MKNLPYQPYLDKITGNNGFIAALDQSGGSTPKALRLYGILESEYSSQEEMFEMVHQMRTRIITSNSFDGNRILGAILFEKTMNGEIFGMDTADYLWRKKQVVPFLKVDKGLDELNEGVQLMKPNPTLEDLLDQAQSKNIFGTKMRSVIKDANKKGVGEVVEQQFEIAKIIINKNLVPIIEPEVDIHCEDKFQAEQMLFENLKNQIDKLTSGQKILLKLTIPSEANLYTPFVDHPNVIRVFALSGGYSRDDSNKLLSLNRGMLASFSRALTEGLSAKQTDEEFDSVLDASIESIFQASIS
tara:strand:+ start:635 stop:1534 length:900 start_codon:yes stop_codon:yes gene_type:complete